MRHQRLRVWGTWAGRCCHGQPAIKQQILTRDPDTGLPVWLPHRVDLHWGQMRLRFIFRCSAGNKAQTQYVCSSLFTHIKESHLQLHTFRKTEERLQELLLSQLAVYSVCGGGYKWHFVTAFKQQWLTSIIVSGTFIKWLSLSWNIHKRALGSLSWDKNRQRDI